MDISNGGFTDGIWKSNFVPVSKKFIVEVIDSSGLSSSAPCKIQVLPNTNLRSLDSYLEKEFDPNIKLLLVEIYKSNIENISTENIKATINNKALDVMSNYIENSNENIQRDLERVIAKILEISNEDFDIQNLS